MAKTKAPAESTSGYFRRVFDENPAWLDAGSNEEVRHRWEQDHSNRAWTKQIAQSMSNVKSILRRKAGKIRRRRRRKGARAGVAVTAPRVRATSLSVLERLEALIDQCLSMARQHGGDNGAGLHGVIKHLRLARNGVVWEIGQPKSGE
jgi:hypothetical protein